MPHLTPSDAARRAFGVRLRDLRLEAALERGELAALTGFSLAKISRAENGVTSLSERDIHKWAEVCHASADETTGLIASRREVEHMWLEYRQRLKLGQKEIQAQGRSDYDGVRLARIYESLHIPGILQTFEYARAQRLLWAQLHGLRVDDIDEAAANRLKMQPLVTVGGGPRFSFLLEATALYNVVGNAAVMDDQYEFLLAAAVKPHVALGIVPLGATRGLFPGEGFYLFDERHVWQEFWSGAFQTRQHADIAYFVRVFTALRAHAVYGPEARAEIEVARNHVHRRAQG